jgi:purine-nucleoside phosphorylase
MYNKQINEIQKITDFEPEIAIVLGSGLGEFADKINIVSTVPYEKISDMPTSTAPSHKGRFVFGTIDNKKVVIMQGRVHLYEGYSEELVVMPIRLMRMLGAKKLILTNASGGINKDYKVGDLMLITDHISLFVNSCLIGKNHDDLGTRFPDMSNAYDKDLQKTVKKVAIKNNIDLKSGTYTQLKGPQFETPAEIKALSVLGSDAVGMSTVIETIAAVHAGFKVCAISLITNLACGILDQPLTSEEVTVAANNAAPEFEKLIKEIVKSI